jgi:sugar lactone lactonase YvrE
MLLRAEGESMSFQVQLGEIEKFGRDLVRPEGVMALNDGTVWTSHGHGHCTRIAPDGKQENLGQLGGEPNGICINHDGSVIVANIGNGQVQRLSLDGRHAIIADSMEGRPMPTPNFPHVDSLGRIWVTNSTDLRRHYDATRHPISDGTLCRIEGGGARILAEGIRFANGVTIDAEEKYVYVAETMDQRVVRYAIHDDGTVGRPENYGPDFGPQGHPDGIAFDAGGNLWVTLVVMNALGIITPAREFHIVVHDPSGTVLRRPTNITFGGRDLRTAYVGSLRGPYIPVFHSPVPGLPLAHQR